MVLGLHAERASSLRESLRHSTRAAHARLDRALGLMSPSVTREGYVAYLGGMWSFHAPLEAKLQASEGLAAHVTDLRARRRAHLASDDLRALGADPSRYPLATPDALPRTADAGEAAGALYVLEGSTLGGRFLAAKLGARLGLEAETRRYLEGYGAETDAMWRRLVAQLDGAPWSAAEREGAARAAEETFSMLHGWLEARGATR